MEVKLGPLARRAEAALGASQHDPWLRANMDEILAAVVDAHRVPAAEILGRCRSKRIAAARNDLYSRLRDAGYSYPEIGDLLDRDHSTIMSGVRAHRGESRR